MIDNAMLYADGMMIRLLRTDRGWTQVELAERAGLEQTTISRAEKDFEGTTLRVLKSIAAALGDGVTVADLLASDREIEEVRLLQAFRALPEQQKAGWVQLAEAIAPADDAAA